MGPHAKKQHDTKNYILEDNFATTKKCVFETRLFEKKNAFKDYQEKFPKPYCAYIVHQKQFPKEDLSTVEIIKRVQASRFLCKKKTCQFIPFIYPQDCKKNFDFCKSKLKSSDGRTRVATVYPNFL